MVWLGLPELRYSHLLPPGTTPHSWGDDDLALAAVPLTRARDYSRVCARLVSTCDLSVLGRSTNLLVFRLSCV